MKKSEGHIAFSETREFFHGPDGTLYQSELTYPIDIYGYRQGARFECMPRQDGHSKYLLEVWEISARSL